MEPGRIVGTSAPRKEGLDKVTGRARYIDDISFPDMLYGATVRSSIPRGKIRSIKFGEGVSWDEFIIVSAKDIPGHNYIALIFNDQPCLADGVVNHCEEPILLLAHQDRHILPKAVAAISIEYEPLRAIFTLEQSESKSDIIWGEDNVFKSYLVEKGNVDSVWSQADHIIEGEYFTGAQEQLYIETNGVIAHFDASQGVTVWGSMQCPYYIHKALLSLFNLPEDKIRVIQTETGGAFGGKEEYPSMIACHAALLAMKSGRHVKMIYDRAEDMAATTKRHPSRTRHRTAVTKDGKILGGEIDFVIDGGAYATLSSVVLSRGTIHAGGAYYWPSVRIRAKAVATNVPPHGAFRGFGAPQSLFALERHIDHIARKLNLPPEEIRRRNFLQPGQTTTTDQIIREPIDMGKLLDRALQLANYELKQRRFTRENSLSANRKKGLGFAAFLHGAGFTGSGERYLNSVVGVEGCVDGTVRVLVSSAEFGQGTNTILCQIAAEALGLPYDDVTIAQPDTANVPNSGPTVASRTAMVVGKLVASAARGLKQTLVAAGLLETCSREQFRNACKDYVSQHGTIRSLARYESPAGVFWDDEKYRGEAYAAFGWAVYVAEVTVDLTTYSVTVDDFVALQEVGRVLHPVLARGQILGGVTQGIGFALYEKVQWHDGRMQNSQMTNYIVPTSSDISMIRVYFEELGNEHGAFGAKGVGELPMDGPAPAIVNAVENAIGIPFNSIPLLPEDIFEAVSPRELPREALTAAL